MGTGKKSGFQKSAVESRLHSTYGIIYWVEMRAQTYISEHSSTLQFEIPNRWSESKVFFDRLGNTLGYKVMDDWYNVVQEDIFRHGGRTILQQFFNNSPSKALQTVYPQHNWLLWKFQQVPRMFWRSEENHKLYFDWLGHQLEYTCMEDWYNVTAEDIQRNKGAGVLSYYGNSPAKALQKIYPHHIWKMNLFRNKILRHHASTFIQDISQQKFTKLPNGFWENKINQRY